MASETEQQPKALDKVANVRKELEQLFADANIREKEDLKELLKEGSEGQINERKWIPISTLLNFAEIKQIEDVNEDDIRAAVARSRYLQLSEDGQQLRRQRYLDRSKRVHRSVVYVDRIPQSADIAWLRLVFSRFGEVDVVSLSHFQDSKVKTGCAYIEFKNEESAQKAIRYYRNLYQRLVQEESFNKDWEETSIDKSSLSESDAKTLEIRQLQRKSLVNILSRPPKAQKKSESKENGAESTTENESAEEKQQVNGEPVEVEPLSAENEKLANDLIVVSLTFYLRIKTNVQMQLRRKPRENRFQRRSKVIRIQLNDHSLELPNSKLRSSIRNLDRFRNISFVEVPVLENGKTNCYVRCKFANRAAGLAEKLSKLGTANVLNDEDEEEYNARVKKALEEKRQKRENGNQNGKQDSSAENADGESSGEKPSRSYPKGVLLKVEADFSNTEENPAREFKGKLFKMPVRKGIAFVDIPRDQESQSTHKTCFVRFKLARFATDFMEQPDVKTLGEITLLDGEEEKEYWEKNIFRGQGSQRGNSSGGRRPNRRFFKQRPTFKGRSFRPRVNNFHKKQNNNSNAANN